MPVNLPHITNLAEYITGWTSTVPAGRGGRHNHAYVEIDYHKTGRGRVLADDGTVADFAAGSLEIMPASVYHTQHQQVTGTDCCVLVDVGAAFPGALQTCMSLALKEADPLADELVRLALLPKPVGAVEQQICNLRITAALLTLLAAGGALQTDAPAASRREQLAQDAHHFIRTHWRTCRTITQIASELSVSSDYLRHVFYERYGLTVYDFLTQQRMDHAKDLLLNSQLPQKQIAKVCGFADIQQFSRRFKQVIRLAPGEYRRAIAET